MPKTSAESTFIGLTSLGDESCEQVPAETLLLCSPVVKKAGLYLLDHLSLRKTFQKQS